MSVACRTTFVLCLLLGLLGEAGSLRAQSFEREVDPFPVRDTAGVTHDFPFLGGLNRPRPQLVDIDDDGDLDLFVQEHYGRIMFFESTGTPAESDFTWRTGRYRGLDVGAWFRFADLDSDGDVDLLAEQPNSYIRYYRNEGTPADPRFALAADTLTDTSDRPLFSDRQNVPALAPLDCQGPPDLFIGQLNGRLAFYEHVGIEEGVPQFQLVSESFHNICVGPASVCGADAVPARVAGVHTGEQRHGANVIDVGDIDGDGDPDLLWGDFFSRSLYLIENTGSCRQPQLERVADTFPPNRPLETGGFNAPHLADIDSDGITDLLVGVLSNAGRDAVENLYLFRQTDDGSFKLHTRRFLRSIDVGQESVPALVDLDADGDLDIVLAGSVAPDGRQSGVLQVFENDRAASGFHAVPSSLNDIRGGFNYAPTFGDLTGNGRPDMLLGRFDGSVAFYRNTNAAGEPEFVREASWNVSLPRGNYAAPVLADLDGDGDLDLLVGEAQGNINFYRNEGTAAAPSFVLVTERYANIEVAGRSHPAVYDADEDGDLDLLIGSRSGLVSYRNVGTPQQPVFAAEDAGPDVAARLAAPAFGALDDVAALLVGSETGGLYYFSYLREGDRNGPVRVGTQVYPNPFTSTVTLAVDLPERAPVELAIFDTLGRRIAVPIAGVMGPGKRRMSLKTDDMAAGAYFYTLRVDGQLEATGRMLKVR